MSGWAAFGGESQIVTTEQNGSDLRLLSQEGEVQALSWGSVLPGGDSTLAVTVSQASRHRSPATNAGRLARVYRGDVVWRGTLAEPAPSDSGGWDVTGQGEGTYGNNLRALAGGGVAGGTPASANAMIDEARTRGLPWVRGNLDVPGIDQTQLFEIGSRTITEALNAFTDQGTLTWTVGGQGSRPPLIRVYPLPVTRPVSSSGPRPAMTPTRLLISPDPVGRTLAGYYNAMVVRYQSSQDDPDGGSEATYGTAQAWYQPQIDVHGRLEGYADFSNAGYMSLGEAQGRAAGILAAYQAISYTQEWTVTPGQVLTPGGSPVDLGLERAGEIYRVLYADIGGGGEVSMADQIVFMSGGYVWDDVAQAGRLTPYQFVPQDFSSLVTAMSPPPQMPSALG
jgi:hypothetical protein